MNRSYIAAALLGLALSAPAFAAEYVVQIGAFRNPDPSFAEPAAAVGAVSNHVTDSGLTRIEVGRFPDRNAATEAMERLRAAGYQDAFVKRTTRGAAAASASATPASTPAVSSAPPRDIQAEIDALPSELRRHAVILDGRLHIKEGNRFIPIADYRR